MCISTTERLLFGADPLTHIVAAELWGGDQVRVYRRRNGEVVAEDVPFAPWLVAEREAPWRAFPGVTGIEPLAGGHPLRHLVTFNSWGAFLDASRAARDSAERVHRLRSPIEQYLAMSGRTLFKGMIFGDLVRLQLDIETTGLDSEAPDARVLMIALRTTDGWEEALLNEGSEADLLHQLNRRIGDLAPDVIEGHNIFNFDLPYLASRANRLGITLSWGRDGSALRIDDYGARFKAGQHTLPFRMATIHGRHIIDTYQQIQRYDVGGQLRSYGLKNAIRELGLERDDRTHLDGAQISSLWQTDPKRLTRYALDDVRDVDTLARLSTQTEFYQTQLLPRTYQVVATGGPGEKINDLLVRAYLAERHSLPQPTAPKDFAGGHAELLATGVFHPVVKCDVESLYPSIMVSQGITSGSDTLGAYLPMLRELTDRRLEAKTRLRAEREAGNVEQSAMWDGIQASFKVLINSFYGYLGYRAGLFNDFDAAARVTNEGQRIVRQVVGELQRNGALPIEVDTDGVYFVPPPGVSHPDEEQEFIAAVSSTLPDGIRLAHDGRYQSMLSLRIKTYALLAEDGVVLLKGSALRNRRTERCLRAFLEEACLAFLEHDPDRARTAYFTLAERMRQRRVAVPDLTQWGLVNNETIGAQPRVKALLQRTCSQGGDRIEYYERDDGVLALREEYAGDENVGYLLRRLHDTAGRFRELYESDSAFRSAFPEITLRTDIEAARNAQPTTQLTMFQ